MRLTRLNQLILNGKNVKGKWRLTPDHDLEYTSLGLDEEIKFSGSLIGAEAGALLFAVTGRQKNQKLVTSIHRLAGAWKTNSKNQLVFEAEKESGKSDVLTFSSGWNLNDNQEIVYTYRRRRLKTKTRTNGELLFRGVWSLSESDALVYSLSGGGQFLRFRGAFQTKSILAKKNEIRYQLGLEVSGKRKIQTLVFFGKWKVSRDLGLHFELEKSGARSLLAFGGEYSLKGSAQIAVDLKTENGKPLGVEVLLTKDIFEKNGQGFIRLQKNLEETNLEAGVRFKW